MQEDRLCPIEYKLLQITASPNSEADKTEALRTLQDIILNLLLSANKEHKILKKDNPKLCSQLWNVEGITDYLLFIGYHEEDKAYVYETCDENMKLLEAVSRALERCLRKRRTGSSQIKAQNKCEGVLSNFFRNKFCKAKDEQPCKLKDFLLKHYEKEDYRSPLMKGQELTNAVGKSECQKSLAPSCYSFNPEGYFQQLCKSRNNSNKNDIRKDLFDAHESCSRKKESSFLPWIKRKKH